MAEQVTSEGANSAATAPAVAVATPQPPRVVPAAVWLVIALQVVAGGYLFIWALTELSPTINLFTDDLFGTWFSLVILMLVLIVAAMGLGLLYLAVLLHRADRVGRGVTYVACGSIAASIFLGSDHSTGFTLAAIACIAAIGALAFLPDVQAFFTGPGAPSGERPSGVVIAQTLIAVWILIVALIGAVYLMLAFAGAAAKFGVIGALLIAIAVGGQRVNADLASGDAGARNIASLGAIAVVLLDLIAGNATGTGLIIPVGWSLGIVAYLWLPQESQGFFAREAAAAPASPAAAPTATTGPALSDSPGVPSPPAGA
jgi:hypothetical protein